MLDRDPDVLLTTDLAVRRRLQALSGDRGVDTSRWAPFRTTALMHLWATVIPALPDPDPDPDRPEET